MTTVVKEILQQVERLSLDEQQELATELNERVANPPVPSHANGSRNGASLPLPAPAESPAQAADGETTVEDDSIFDVFSLNRVPPQRTYTMQVTYKFIGRGKPLPYELADDLLEEETEGEAEPG